MSGVPDAWTAMIERLRAAQLAREGMLSPEATQQLRDVATVAYARAVDQLVDALTVLSEGHVLGRLTMHLAKKERA